jgi:hypothetical protein
MNLCIKYKPINFKNIIGNKKIYKKLLDDLEKSKYKGNYLLHGNVGTCKSTFVEILANQKKIKLEKIYIDNITIDDSLIPIFKNTIIKKIIVIDNIDLTIKSIETKMKKIKKYINLNKNNLLFIISNENKNSVFKDYINLKKYKFKIIEEKLIKKFIENILEKEDIKLSKKNKDYILKKVIKNGNFNIRKILLNLQILLLLLFEQKKNKLLLTDDTNYNITKNQNDMFYNNIYDIIYLSLKPYKKENQRSYIQKEKIYYTDEFLITSSVYEYYLYDENKDLENKYNIIESLTNSDILPYMEFSLTPYKANNSLMIPNYNLTKIKKQLFYPSNVSKDNKILNNKKKYIEIKNSNNYTPEDFMYLYFIQKTMKIKKKDQKIKNKDIKDIFSIL